MEIRHSAFTKRYINVAKWKNCAIHSPFRCLTVSVPPCSLSLISGQYWAHLFYCKWNDKRERSLSKEMDLILNFPKNIQRAIKCKLQWLGTIAANTFITEVSFPSISTPSVTETRHVVTGSAVSTMSYTLLGTVHTIQSFSTLCYTEKCS